MNPDDILTEGWVNDPELFPQQDLPDQVQRSKDYYAYRRRYADGREVWEYFKRNSGQGGQDSVLTSQTITIPKIKEEFDKNKQKESASAQESISAPPNQQFVLRTGPKNAEHPDGIYQYPNPSYVPPAGGANAPGQKITIENGEVVTREIQPDGSPGRIVSQKPATKAEIDAIGGGTGTTGAKRIPVTGKPGVFQVTNDVKDAQGNTTSETHFEDEAGNRVPTPGAEGTTGAQRTPVPEHPGIYQVTNATKDAQGNATTETHFEDEQGNRVATPTKPTATAAAGEARVQMVPDPNNPGQLIAKPIPGTDRAAPPDIGALKAELGNIVPELQDRWQKYLDYVQKSGGTYTMADAEKDITRDREMAQARANELTTQLNAQQNIRSQDITQRGQTLQDASSRQRFAETASTNAMNMMTKFPSIAAAAGNGEGFKNALGFLMNMQGEYGKTIGALPDQTPIGRAPGQEQAMGLGINGPGSNGPAPGVGPNGSSPIVFNINTNGTSPMPLGDMGATMAAGAQPAPVDTAQATPVGSPGSPSQLIDQWADPKDPMWNSTLEQIKAEITQPQGGPQAVDRRNNMRFAGGQLRAPGAGPVMGGPVSNGPVGAVG